MFGCCSLGMKEFFYELRFKFFLSENFNFFKVWKCLKKVFTTRGKRIFLLLLFIEGGSICACGKSIMFCFPSYKMRASLMSLAYIHLVDFFHTKRDHNSIWIFVFCGFRWWWRLHTLSPDKWLEMLYVCW